MMAVGKTTLGKMVAKNHDLEFIDTDAVIENKYSMSVNDIFEKKGEKFFRNEEKKEVLKQLKKNNCIIALGGGAFMDKNVRKSVLKSAISIWLDIDIKILIERSKWSRKRPLLNEGNSQKKLTNLYVQRKNIYKFANHKIICDKLHKKDIVKKITAVYEKY